MPHAAWESPTGVMDYQCLFEHDVSHRDGANQARNDEIPNEAMFYSPSTSSTNPRLIRLMRFSHEKSRVKVQDTILGPDEALRRLEGPELSQVPGLQLLLSGPRGEARDEHGMLRKYNPEAPFPFDNKSLIEVVNILKFHKVCLRNLSGARPELGQVARILGPDGLTSFYSETYSYRTGWHKICVSYAPKTMSSSIFVHNLSVKDTRALVSRLSKPSIQPLTIHPMLVPLLIYEFTFDQCHKELYRIFSGCISLYLTFGLNSNRAHAHLRDYDADDKQATELAFGAGQSVIGLEERVDFSIMMGKKLLSFFDDLEQKTPEEEMKTTFIEAGSIIRGRLEYLIECLEFQLPRLRRAKDHAQLNRTGLENRTAAQSNRIQYQIAVETRADSSAMKAIALLTMLFLPGTFVSALFAMPMFDWNAESRSEVVSNRFWIYWAVTVPGTLAVLAIWRLWWMFEEWRVRKEEAGHFWWRDAWAWIKARGRHEPKKIKIDEDAVEKKLNKV